MLSYKEWKLINEAYSGTYNLGVKSPKSFVVGSKLEEMGFPKFMPKAAPKGADVDDDDADMDDSEDGDMDDDDLDMDPNGVDDHSGEADPADYGIDAADPSAMGGPDDMGGMDDPTMGGGSDDMGGDGGFDPNQFGDELSILDLMGGQGGSPKGMGGGPDDMSADPSAMDDMGDDSSMDMGDDDMSKLAGIAPDDDNDADDAVSSDEEPSDDDNDVDDDDSSPFGKKFMSKDGGKKYCGSGCTEESFFSSLCGQMNDGKPKKNLSGISEDMLFPQTFDQNVENDEPGPGEVGFAPQQRIGQIQSLANYSESKQNKVGKVNKKNRKK